jgi:hypothetical protein
VNDVNANKHIRIDREVYAELMKRAIPLKDTPNSVLRRVLGLPDA